MTPFSHIRSDLSESPGSFLTRMVASQSSDVATMRGLEGDAAVHAQPARAFHHPWVAEAVHRYIADQVRKQIVLDAFLLFFFFLSNFDFLLSLAPVSGTIFIKWVAEFVSSPDKTVLWNSLFCIILNTKKNTSIK